METVRELQGRKLISYPVCYRHPPAMRPFCIRVHRLVQYTWNIQQIEIRARASIYIELIRVSGWSSTFCGLKIGQHLFILSGRRTLIQVEKQGL